MAAGNVQTVNCTRFAYVKHRASTLSLTLSISLIIRIEIGTAKIIR